MARWEPGAADRLRRTALELFATRGFEQTTAAEIAEAAGLTQRTFFRHFSDKRDVLFQGQEEYVQRFLAGIESAPAGATPMQLVAAALAGGAAWFDDEHRPYARTRQNVIDANPPLRERERHKRADLAVRIATALHDRGVDEPMATLAAESGSTVFSVSFAQWIRPEETRSLGAICATTLDQLLTLGSARQ